MQTHISNLCFLIYLDVISSVKGSLYFFSYKSVIPQKNLALSLTCSNTMLLGDYQWDLILSLTKNARSGKAESNSIFVA